MSLRRFAFATSVVGAGVLLGACHLLLSGQDVGDGAGTGAGGLGGQGQGGSGQGGGPTATAATGCIMIPDGVDATEASCRGGVQNATPCVTDTNNTGGGRDSCYADDGHQLFRFRTDCAHGDPWCRYSPPGADALVTNGNLEITGPPRTGFWSPDGTLQFPPYLYRTIADGGDFAFATEVTALNADGSHPYAVAGLVVRVPGESWEPGGNEQWIKLEYGFRAAANDAAMYKEWGVLVGQGIGSSADHLAGTTPGSRVQELPIKLGVCRIGENFTFAYGIGGNWEPVHLMRVPPEYVDQLQVGLTTGTFYDRSPAISGTFSWAAILVQDIGSCDCVDVLKGLDQDC